jgi:hypothetical protein
MAAQPRKRERRERCVRVAAASGPDGRGGTRWTAQICLSSELDGRMGHSGTSNFNCDFPPFGSM